MKVLLTPQSQIDISAIHAYIARDKEHSADLMVARIQASFARIAQFPEAGRPTRLLNIREVIVAPYVVPYRVKKKQQVVDILRILHGKQDRSLSG